MATAARLALLLSVLLVSNGSVLGEDNNRQIENENLNYRLPTNVVPFHYDLKLIPSNYTFTGRVAIKLQVLNETKSIVVHNKNLTIEPSATFLSSINEFHVRVPVSQYHNRETEMVTIYFANEIKPDNYTLYLKFHGVYNRNRDGFYRVSYFDENKNKMWMTVTEFEPTFARGSFPCMDEPALKATFDIAIKHDVQFRAVSNMPILKQSLIDQSDGKIWTQFQTTPPISTYIVNFVIFDYTRIRNPKGTVNVWCRPEAMPSAQFAFELAEKSVIELERVLNTSLDLPKLDHVCVPGMLHEGQEAWGLILYRESKFLYNESLRSVDDKQEAALLVVHEIAHQWFGNAVTPSWWKYQWLKEGLASYFEYYVVSKIFPDWQVFDFFVPEVLHPTFIRDVRRKMPLTHDVSTPKEILSILGYIVYDKAPSLMRMVQHHMTQKVFLKGLSYYLQKYKYDVASPEEFWDSMQTAFDESNVTPKFNLKKVMDGWYTQAGFPVINVTVNRENGAVSVSQDCFNSTYVETREKRNDTTCKNKWWIPINFATLSEADFSSTQLTHWLSPEDDDNHHITTIDPQDWIIVNIQQTGLYRVNYDETTWRLIIRQLHSSDYKTIHHLNRAQILDDSYNLMISGQLDSLVFMDLSDYLRHETDCIPWITAFNIFDAIDEYELKTNGYLRQHIWELVDGLIDRIGFDDVTTDDHMIKKLRHKLRESSCNTGHPKCLNHAHKKLLGVLENPQKSWISSFLSSWTLCYGLKNANASTWLRTQELLEKENRLKRRYLACVNNPDIINLYLNYSISGSEFLLSQEKIIFIVDSILLSHPEYADLVMDFIIGNWETIISRVDYPTSLIRYLSNSITSGDFNRFPEQLEKMVNFLRSVNVEKLEIKRIADDINQPTPPFVEKIRDWLRSRYAPWTIQNTSVYPIS